MLKKLSEGGLLRGGHVTLGTDLVAIPSFGLWSSKSGINYINANTEKNEFNYISLENQMFGYLNNVAK